MIVRGVPGALTISLLIGCAGAAPVPPQTKHVNILWRNPGRVETLDMANGVGGSVRSPRPPYRFIKEDPSGSNPKIKVKDARGAEWSLK